MFILIIETHNFEALESIFKIIYHDVTDVNDVSNVIEPMALVYRCVWMFESSKGVFLYKQRTRLKDPVCGLMCIAYSSFK